ncbi:MAG TPA: FMN-binding protein [Thermoanaerobaculia bacterium]|nr:FMN-binding protein [Thermoanaerobaculia bacterium]
MEHRHRLHLLIALCAVALAAQARVFMTQQQALASAFPAGTRVERQSVFLTPQQLAAARKESGVEFKDQLIVRYVGTAADRVVGYAYFDTHRVRTLPETVMIVVTPDAKIEKIDILSFDEPPDYFPKPRWLEQFRGRRLDDDLSLKRSIRPISGASLTGRAFVNASRKILALHRAIGAK